MIAPFANRPATSRSATATGARLASVSEERKVMTYRAVMPTSALQLIPDAIGRFGAPVLAVDDHRWNDPTPCTEWTVGELVNHLESLDPAAVDYSLAYAHANVERIAGLGIVAPPVPTTSSDPAVRLLSLVGRVV